MAFRFERADGSVEASLRRLAVERIDLALEEIAAAEGRKAVEHAVHGARKNCKRLRSLLRLVRPSFRRFARENAAIRDAAAKLSPLRDADVLPATFDKVAERLGEQLEAKAAAGFRRSLVARANRLKAGLDAESALARLRDELSAVRMRVPDWRLKDDGFAAISKGFAATYRRGRRDRKAVGSAPSAENFHEWRKQVKNHFYHLCLLRDVAPHMLDGQRDLARELAETLGDHHDIAVFLLVLADEPEAFRAVDGVREVREALQERQDLLGALALRLGDELLSERPRGLEERLGRYWSNWHRIGGDAHGPRDRAQVPGAA